jgi:dihydrolipoamide dehydrogenase
MKKKISLLLFLVAIFALFKYFNLGSYLTLDYIKQNQAMLQSYYLENQVLTMSLFFFGYVIATAMSFPGATILTLLGGAIFGLSYGLLIVSFASTIGATLAFLFSRTILRESVQKKFGDKLKTFNDGVNNEGAFYLFTLRLVPVFPFFLINMVMGLTSMKVGTYFIVSQLGMLIGTAVYVNAGVQLSQLETLSGILSPAMIGSFIALGILPIMSKKIIDFIKAKKVYKKFTKPKKIDYNMVVIGAGSAGLVTSYIAAAVKAKVALIEKEKMGGDCLNTGCVPSKALIKSAKVAHTINKSSEYGINSSIDSVDFAKAMNRVHDVIGKIEPHDSIERYSSLGVECHTGTAKIISPWEVEVNGKILTTKNITIATGASPFVPQIPGIEKVDYLTSNNLWNIRELPKKFVVLGGGPIGLEMAQSFNRFGSEVTVVEMGGRIMSREDEDVSAEVTAKLESEGVVVKTSHKAIKFEGNVLICETTQGHVEIEFDKVLVAVGRKPNIKGFGLENLDITLRKNGTIEANGYLQTNYPNIYVCGDVTGPFQLTHTAAHQAWYCAVNALFSPFKKFKVDYSVIPWCTYTDPEVATVGHTEATAKDAALDYEITKYGIDDLDRAIADGNDYGFVKVLTAKGSDKILGATIVGVGAGELLAEFVTNMKYKKGLNSILGTIHSYPTMAEANKFAAGNWKKANAPQNLLKWVQRFHKWRISK